MKKRKLSKKSKVTCTNCEAEVEVTAGKISRPFRCNSCGATLFVKKIDNEVIVHDCRVQS